MPDLGTSGYPLVQAVGYVRAVEICLTGRRVDADEAVAFGLALRSVPVDELVAAVDELATALAGAPAAIFAVRRDATIASSWSCIAAQPVRSAASLEHPVPVEVSQIAAAALRTANRRSAFSLVRRRGRRPRWYVPLGSGWSNLDHRVDGGWRLVPTSSGWPPRS